MRLEAIMDCGLRDTCLDTLMSPPFRVSKDLLILRSLFQSNICSETYTPEKRPLDFVLDSVGCDSFSSSDFVIQLNMTRWKLLETYLNTLCKYADVTYRRSLRREVVVVGAGPVGLLHALEARLLFGSHVTIIEKRTSFTRNMWFDLGPRSWYDTLGQLSSLGLQYLEFEQLIQHPDLDDSTTDVITVRCQVLQRILTKTAWIAGITFHFGSTFQSLESPSPGSSKMSIQASTDLGGTLYLPFDLLIAADGASSLIRSHLHLNYNHQTNFYIDSRIPISIPHLSQPTLLINFKPTADGMCPDLTRSPSGHGRESHEPGMVIPGVTHVFKRFYFGRCHLQVLFTQERASQMNRQVVPWDLILELISFLFSSPFESIESLQQSVIEVDTEEGKRYDHEFFDIEIRSTSASVLLPPYDTTSIVEIVGDASITAHYRMGVGINNGVRQLEMTRRILSKRFWSSLAQEIHEFNQNEQDELKKLAQFEAYLIATEAYCDYVVGLDAHKPRYSHSTWLRNRSLYKEEGEGGLFQLKGMEVFTNCPHLSP